jgi:hypothetical protein
VASTGDIGSTQTCAVAEADQRGQHAAIEIAADKFYGLCLADRADAIIFDGTLDYFEAEEVQP